MSVYVISQRRSDAGAYFEGPNLQKLDDYRRNGDRSLTVTERGAHVVV